MCKRGISQDPAIKESVPSTDQQDRANGLLGTSNAFASSDRQQSSAYCIHCEGDLPDNHPMLTEVFSIGAPGSRVCCCTSWASLLSKYLSTLSESTFRGAGRRLKKVRNSARSFWRNSSRPPSFKIGPTTQHLSNGAVTAIFPDKRSLNPFRMVLWISGVSKYSCFHCSYEA